MDYAKRYIYLNAILADSSFGYATLSNAVPVTPGGSSAVASGYNTSVYTAVNLPVVCPAQIPGTYQTGNIGSVLQPPALG